MSDPYGWFNKYRIVRLGNEYLQDLRGGNDQGEDINTDVITLTCDRPAATITPKGFVLLITAFLAFKGVVIAHLGFDIYAAAVQKLQNGAFVEKVGAFIMHPDVVSQAIAGQLGGILH